MNLLLLIAKEGSRNPRPSIAEQTGGRKMKRSRESEKLYLGVELSASEVIRAISVTLQDLT